MTADDPLRAACVEYHRYHIQIKPWNYGVEFRNLQYTWNLVLPDTGQEVYGIVIGNSAGAADHDGIGT
ncbi:hypothetical protein D3C81_1197620 [compost metagenome]